MSVDTTPWPPATGPHGEAFGDTCRSVMALLMSVPREVLVARLADPRLVHRALYEGVLSPDGRFLAGAYRGSDHPYLATLEVGFAFTETDGTTDFAPPREVRGLMASYGKDVTSFAAIDHAATPELVREAAKVIATFGYIHPFWDGNGHIQRLTFRGLLHLRELELAESWTIHPCPYGEDVSRALASRDPTRIADLLTPFVA